MKDNKVKDNRSKSKLKLEERVLIEHYYMKKKIIDKQLWRDRKTISREIKRNGYYNRWWYWVCKAEISEMKTMKRRLKANRKHVKLFKWESLVSQINFRKELIV